MRPAFPSRPTPGRRFPSTTGAMNDELLDTIRKRIVAFPKSPGVYLMKDAEGRVLYIGKAKYLRSQSGSVST